MARAAAFLERSRQDDELDEEDRSLAQAYIVQSMNDAPSRRLARRVALPEPVRLHPAVEVLDAAERSTLDVAARVDFAWCSTAPPGVRAVAVVEDDEVGAEPIDPREAHEELLAGNAGERSRIASAETATFRSRILVGVLDGRSRHLCIREHRTMRECSRGPGRIADRFHVAWALLAIACGGPPTAASSTHAPETATPAAPAPSTVTAETHDEALLPSTITCTFPTSESSERSDREIDRVGWMESDGPPAAEGAAQAVRWAGADLRGAFLGHGLLLPPHYASMPFLSLVARQFVVGRYDARPHSIYVASAQPREIELRTVAPGFEANNVRRAPSFATDDGGGIVVLGGEYVSDDVTTELVLRFDPAGNIAASRTFSWPSGDGVSLSVAVGPGGLAARTSSATGSDVVTLYPLDGSATTTIHVPAARPPCATDDAEWTLYLEDGGVGVEGRFWAGATIDVVRITGGSACLAAVLPGTLAASGAPVVVRPEAAGYRGNAIDATGELVTFPCTR